MEDGFKIDRDICLYRAPRKSIRGRVIFSGKDIFFGQENERMYFYIRYWNRGWIARYEMIPKDEAKRILQQLIPKMNADEIQKCKQIWPNFLEETVYPIIPIKNKKKGDEKIWDGLQ
ncbi:MAG: hypothetical protein QW046_01910 [Candidatus Micrarchaeaceae archaeon]